MRRNNTLRRESAIVLAALLLSLFELRADDAKSRVGETVLPRRPDVTVHFTDLRGKTVRDPLTRSPPFPWEVLKEAGDQLIVRQDRVRTGSVAKDDVVLLTDAASYFAELIHKQPDDFWPLLMRGIAMKSQKDYAGAVRDFSEAIRIEPKKAELYVQRAAAYALQRQADLAIADANEAQRLARSTATASQASGVGPRRKEDLDKTIAGCTEAIRQNPQNVDAYERRMYALQRKGDYERALADANVVVAAERTEFNLSSRALLFIHLKQYDRAIDDLTEAIRIHPSDATWYSIRGDTYVDMKDYDRGLSDLNRSIELDPTNGLHFSARGRAHQAKRDYELALKDFTAATRLPLNLRTSDARAFSALALLRAACPVDKLRDGDRAIELATKACELTGWNLPEFQDTLATAYAETSDFDGAVKWEKKALADPNFSKQADVLEDAKKRLSLFEQRQPYRLK